MYILYSLVHKRFSSNKFSFACFYFINLCRYIKGQFLKNEMRTPSKTSCFKRQPNIFCTYTFIHIFLAPILRWIKYVPNMYGKEKIRKIFKNTCTFREVGKPKKEVLLSNPYYYTYHYILYIYLLYIYTTIYTLYTQYT